MSVPNVVMDVEVELDVPTWQILPWDQVHTTAELLAMRARQIQRRVEDLLEATLHLQRMRSENKKLFDEKHRIRRTEFKVNDLILIHDTKIDNQHSQKLTFR